MGNPRLHAEAQGSLGVPDRTPHPAFSRSGNRAWTRGGPIVLAAVAGLVAAIAATRADGVETGDCEPSGIHVDLGGQPLTRAEKIARMDQAFHDSLARFDQCHSGAATAASQSPESHTDPGGDAGGTANATGERAPTESVAAQEMQGTEAPQDDDSSSADPRPPPASDAGKVPDDIPEPDNDSVLEGQIRRAAMEETDPRLRAELWNEYRKYKGLPSKPLPEDDGERADAQTSE